MSGLFEKGFNKYADFANKFNKSVNKVMGKEVLVEMKKIEAPREFQPYESFPKYSYPEPTQWESFTGNAKEFTLDGYTISISSNLDTCMQYKDLFKSTAKFYADRFEFMYHQCVTDYDTLLNYFEDMYFEGLYAMTDRAYNILLLFGIFNVSKEQFRSYQINTYNRAVNSYTTMLSIETNKNQSAKNLGNTVGNSIQMQGGGFGFKGAMKGVAQAEAFNIGVNLLGKFVESQNRMTKEEKEAVFSKFKENIFFKEVYFDYANSFYTTIQTLSESGVLGDVSTLTDNEYNTMVNNLKNPMFPKDKVASLLVELISKYPFTTASYEVLKERYGETDEVQEIIKYFEY